MLTLPTWVYNSKPITNLNDFPKDTFGFIYIVKNNDTNKSYIGKKVLYHNKKVKLGKKEVAELTGVGRKPTTKIVTKESDWETYYGSNKEVMQLIKDGKQDLFTRTIIKLASNKKLLTYYETQALFTYKVLEQPESFYNDNILGKFFTKDFTL
jgi:hypothetical protein